jgi:hypothetical protein
VAAALIGLAGLGLMRSPSPAFAGESLRTQAAEASGGVPILADDINAEALALDGRRIWISNPLDAFGHADQRLYLDWIAGRPRADALLAPFRAVLVTIDSPAERRLARSNDWREAARDEKAVLYVRARG